MPILIGIDGTGSEFFGGEERNANYDIDFAQSFVRRLALSTKPHRQYYRGPRALGNGLSGAIKNAYHYIVATLEFNDEPVLLTGYSRGAAGVVSLANRLRKKGIDVEALLLFDCVDRHLLIDAEVIPANVRHCMHVIRDPLSESRKSFSNDGLKYYPSKTKMSWNKFLCTHGGMGGTPWKMTGKKPSDLIVESFPDGKTKVTYEQDHRISAQVWAWVQPFVKEHGFHD